jgi:hypothetical protein
MIMAEVMLPPSRIAVTATAATCTAGTSPVSLGSIKSMYRAVTAPSFGHSACATWARRTAAYCA